MPARRTFPKSMSFCAHRCAASSRLKSSHTRLSGKSKASSRAKCCAIWEVWDFLVSAIPPATAGRKWILWRPLCSRRSWPLDIRRCCNHCARPYRYGVGSRLQRRQRGAEGQVDAAHHLRRDDHRRRGDRAGRWLGRQRHPHGGALEGLAAFSTVPRCSSPMACTRIFFAWRQRPTVVASPVADYHVPGREGHARFHRQPGAR